MKIDNETFFSVIENHFSHCSPLDNIIELKTSTNIGVKMFVTIDKESKKSYYKQFKEYVEKFNVVEEVETHRRYDHVCSTLTSSELAKDFEAYKERLEKILTEIKDEYANGVAAILKKYHVAHNFFNVINEDNESEAVEKTIGSGYLDDAFLLAYRLTQIDGLELNRKNVMDNYEKVSAREYVIFNTNDVLTFINNPLSVLHEAYSDYLVNGVLYEDNEKYKPDFEHDKINFNDFSPSIENCFILEEQLYYLLE